MAATAGRKLRIKKGSTAVAGARSDNITINNEPIDITDKDKAGWRTMLADVGVRSIDATVEGVLLDSTLIAIMVGTASSLLSAWTLDIDGIGSFTGNFYMNSFEITGEQEDAILFTASIQSSGTITFTPVQSMPVFRDVTINFRGADYRVTPSLRLMRTIESEGVSIAEIGVRASQGKPPMSLLATVLHRMLASAGASFSEDEVYGEMMGGDGDQLRKLCDHVLYAFMPQEDTGKNPDAPSAS